jgi:hypothetical protein
MLHQFILSFIIALISLIILRGYDKFNNKQYERHIYINQFFLILISSIIVLYIDNHFDNYNSSNQQGGNNSFNKLHKDNKPQSVIKTNLEKLKMNFDTGMPNF